MRLRLILLGAALLAGLPLWAAGVKVAFNPMAPEIGPYPTDFLSVADPAQKTGLRINLPLPNCQAEPSTCLEIGLLNQLDGFNVFPRIRVRFSGPVNPDSLRAGVFFVWLDQLERGRFGMQPTGHVTTIDQVLYDPKTNTAYAKPDHVLEQIRRYALVITDQVRDVSGAAVEPHDGFQACLARKIGGGYCEQLSAVVGSLEARFAPARIVGASTFTTLSTTAWLEKARAQLPLTPVNPKPGGIFNVADLQSITVRLQEGVQPLKFKESPLPVAALAGVGRVVFGSYRSPFALDRTYSIPVTPSGLDLPAPAASQEIFFMAFYPATPAPPAGYPVVIVGHQFPDNRFGLPVAMAGTLAARGFASISINALGAGYGPEGKVVVADKAGKVTELPAGGRSLDANGDGVIIEGEGAWNVFLFRDTARQDALDQLQLVRAIQSGIDLDGNGRPDLDRDRIHYAGVCIGGITGMMIHSVEPAIQSTVINSTPSTVTSAVDWMRTLRPLFIMMLGVHQPPLLNKGMDYDADGVLRYQPAKIITVPGAVEIQEYLERLEWAGVEGMPLGFAPHLRWATLPGVPMRRTMFQFAIGGDTFIPTPGLTATVRAANMGDMTSVYRHDLARAVVPELAQSEAHFYLIPMGPPAQMAIALAAQRQIAEFFASDAWAVPDVNPLVRPLFGKDLFETPAMLPEVIIW